MQTLKDLADKVDLAYTAKVDAQDLNDAELIAETACLYYAAYAAYILAATGKTDAARVLNGRGE